MRDRDFEGKVAAQRQPAIPEVVGAIRDAGDECKVDDGMMAALGVTLPD